jgi:hypothetical protein
MQSGDRCPKCKDGRMRCRSSRPIENYQQQYLECQKCDHKETVVVPENKVWRRT